MTAGKVIGIFISERSTLPPISVADARVVAQRGLEGDRYFKRRGTFSDSEPQGPGREVTLIEQEALDSLKGAHGIPLSGEESRRNILTQGIRLNDLVGSRFRIGEVSLEGIRLCHPCAHLEELTGKKVMVALTNRGGLRANAVTDGRIRVGDAIVREDE